MNDTDLKILKFWRMGLTPERIARKIGRPGDVARVHDTLRRSREKENRGHAVAEQIEKEVARGDWE